MCPAPPSLLKGFALCPYLWVWTGFFSSLSPLYLGSCCFTLSRCADLSFPQVLCSRCTSRSPSPRGSPWPQGSPSSPSMPGALGAGQAVFITLASGWGAMWTPHPLLWHLGRVPPTRAGDTFPSPHRDRSEPGPGWAEVIATCKATEMLKTGWEARTKWMTEELCINSPSSLLSPTLALSPLHLKVTSPHLCSSAIWFP